MADYSVEHTLSYSLNLNRDPCSEKASWKEDDCPLGIIFEKIMETFNCTAPWLLKFTRYFIIKLDKVALLVTKPPHAISKPRLNADSSQNCKKN